VERIRREPGTDRGAECCAGEAGLSFSRFLHLFRAETGVPFRSFKVWKRARSMLRHVTRDANLTHLALEIGYPGASHFSNTIRQVFGMQPRVMFAGSRRLQVLTPGEGG
jgi:AraC-like DNA-binding protein